jgi:hypothetical protein
MSYDDAITHPAITEAAVKISSLGTAKYLSTNLGDVFSKDFDSSIDGLPVIKYFVVGSSEEDSPNCRASSHFLNPLQEWKEAGVSDTNETLFGFGVNTACFVTAPFSSRFSIHKYSDVTWATGYTSPISGLSNTDNDMDWNAARIYYRLALTEPDNNTREENFAKMFQTLGQVMHLLQDMAVPAHVRNDFTAHLAFQKAGLSLPNKWYGNTYEWYVKDRKNQEIITSAMASSSAVSPPKSLTALWDANKYDGSNPPLNNDQGLAEYTNANFFSEATIFAERKDSEDIHYFPRPAKADTNASEVEIQAVAMEVTAEDNIKDRTIYITKNNDGCKLAAHSFLRKWVEHKIVDDGYTPYEITGYISSWEYNLDDEVYKDYAKHLIPRAVGYSAALIDYFFRGQIDMVPNPGNSGQYVIKNESDEDMSGTFSLHYDDTDGIRKPVKGAEGVNLSIAAKGTSNSLIFTAPNDAKEAGKYILVFNGRHGREDGAVVGSLVQVNQIPQARVVTVGTKWYNNGYIKLLIGNKQITKQVDNGTIRQISSARFDLENNNIFYIMSYEWGKSECKHCTEFHKFEIDENNSVINYLGIASRVNHDHSLDEEIIDELIWPDMGGAERYYNGSMQKSVSTGYRMILFIMHDVSPGFEDFYVENGAIKPFRKLYEKKSSWIYYAYYDIWPNGEWTGMWGENFGPKLEDVEIEKIYYGDRLIDENIVKNCINGSFDISTYHFIECKQDNVGNKRINPLAIFNENDYAYDIFENNTITTYSSIDIPIENRYDYYGIIRSMLRKDDKYSFYLDSRLAGQGGYKKYYSYSSEVGVLPCMYNLMASINIGGKYIGWNKNNGLISASACTDVVRYGMANVYLNDDYVFDISIKN